MSFDEVFEDRHSQILTMMKRLESGRLKVFCIIADKFLGEVLFSVHRLCWIFNDID